MPATSPLALLLPALVMALVACEEKAPPSSGPSSASSAAFPNSDTVSNSIEYESVEDLADAAVKAGWACPNRKVEVTDTGLKMPDITSITCGGVFMQLLLVSYTTTEELQAAAHADAEQLSPSGDYVLLGVNWSARGHKERIISMQKAVGGEYAEIA